MVVAPLKPSSFKTRVPSVPEEASVLITHPDTLVVIVGADSSLKLNNELDMGTVNDPSKLIERIKEVFGKRILSGNISTSFGNDPGRPTPDRIERAIFIKAPRTLDYGSVARVVDAVKLARAFPISLQIDYLDE
jgi:biopolymer transport protein ExbD